MSHKSIKKTKWKIKGESVNTRISKFISSTKMTRIQKRIPFSYNFPTYILTYLYNFYQDKTERVYPCVALWSVY